MVTGRHLTVTDAAQTQIRQQLGRLERLLGDSAVSAQCVIGRERNRYLAELTLHARGDNMLHAAAAHARLERAVSAAVQKIAQQAKRVKGRWEVRRRGGPARVPRPAPARPAPPRVVRSKAAAAKPLSLDDALLALEASRDGIVVFRHAESGAVAVVFRRPDGRVGLVEPEA
jgi:putative sigma-54 modulation protein